MNVIAKSTALSPFLRATATAVSNGGIPVAGTSKVPRPKIEVIPPASPVLAQTMHRELPVGTVCISSGISGAYVTPSAIQFSTSLIDERPAPVIFTDETGTIRLAWLYNRFVHFPSYCAIRRAYVRLHLAPKSLIDDNTLIVAYFFDENLPRLDERRDVGCLSLQ